eukprot:403343624
MHFKSGQSYGNQQLMAQQHLNMSKTIMRQRTGAPNNQMLYNTLSNGGDNQFGITLSKYQSTQQPVNRDLDQNIMFTSIDRRQNNIRPHHGGSQNSMDQQNGRSIVLPSSIQIGRVGINRNTSQKDFRNKKMSAIFQNGDQSISSKNMFQMQMSSSHKSQNEGTKSQFLTKQSQMNNLGSFTDNLQQNSKPLYQTIASNNQQNFQMTLQEQEKKRSKDIMMKLFPKQLKFIDQSEKDQQVQMSKLGYIRKLNYQSQANLYANQQTNHHHTQKHSVFCSQKHSMISTHQNQVENHDQNLRKIIQRQDTVESSNMHLSPLTQTVNFKVDGKLNQWSQMTDVAYKLIKSLKRDTAQTKEIFQETQDQIKSLNYKLVQVIPKKDSHIILEEKKDNNFKISHGQEHIFAKISIKNMPQPLFVISIKQKQKTQNSDLDYQIYFSRYDRFPDPDSKVSDLQRRSHNQMYLYQDLSSKVFKEDWLYIGIHNIRLKNLNQSQISIRFAFQRYSKQDFRQNEYRGSSMGLVSSNSSPRFSKTGDGSKMMRIKLQSQLKDILDDQDRCQEFIDNIEDLKQKRLMSRQSNINNTQKIAIQVFLNSKPSYMSVSDFKVNTAQKKKEDLDMESHQKMLFLLNKRQIINGFKAQLEERKRQIQSKRLFKQKWLIMQVQHKVGLKILENIQIRKQQKDFAVKLFFSTLKLLKVWRIYVKKFGFPKSVRDHKLTRHYLSLTNNLMYEPVCDRAKLLLLAFLRGKKEKKLIFKQFEKFSLQIETMQRVFRAQLKLAATRTKLLSKFWEKKVIQLQKDLSKKRGSNRTKKDVKVLKNLFLLPDNLKTNCLKDYLLKCKRAYMKAISEWLEQYNKFKDSQHNVFLLQKMITFNQNKEEEQSGINQHRKQFSQEYKAKLSELSCDFEEDEVDQQVKVKFSKIKNAQTQDKQVKFQPQGSFKGLQKSLTLNSQQSFNSTVLQEYLNNERVQDMNQLDDNSENSKSKTEKNKSKNQKSGFAKQAQNKQSSFKINHNRKSNNDNSNNDNASSKNQLYEQNAIDQKQTSYQDLMNKKPKFIYLPTSQVMTDLVYQCTWEFVKSEIEREKFSKKVANQVMNTDMMSSDGGMSDQENWNKGLLASDDKNNLNTGDAKTLITELTD